MTPTNIPTRYAIIKRMEKMLSDIDKYFEEASDFGLSVAESDPKGDLTSIRKGLISTLLREGRLSAAGRTELKNYTPPLPAPPLARKEEQKNG